MTLDNKTLQTWLDTWKDIANAMRDLAIESSRIRDENADVASLLFQAARHLSDASKLINRAILVASAEEDDNG